MTFETNVFLNCPFDDEYKKLLRPLLFTLIFLGLKPRIATERMESGEQRITKIIGLIEESKYAIHDLSRLKAEKKGDMFRLNMPYELGIDVGCRHFGKPPLNTKRYLVLAAERYAYQAAISDISGTDISAHNNDATEIVRVVRAWIANQIGTHVVGSGAIWSAFTDFMAQLYDDLVAQGFDAKETEHLPLSELIARMESWVINTKFKKALLSPAAPGVTSGSFPRKRIVRAAGTMKAA